MSFLANFHQPYPLLPFKEVLFRDFLFFVFITIFLLIFQPFGLDVYAYNRVYLIVGYAVVTFLGVLLNDCVGYIFFKDIFSEKNWTVSTQIVWAIWVIFSLGIINFLYGVWIEAFPWSLWGFLKVQTYVVLCSSVPIALVVLFRQNYLLRQNLYEARAMTEMIAQHNDQPVDGEVIFFAENQKDSISLNSEAILYIESIDNYVELVWHESSSIKKTLLRSTLTKIEETLQYNPAFFRCHRAYIVNSRHIEHVEGNSQGYKLSLKYLQNNIPVARAKGKLLKEILEK